MKVYQVKESVEEKVEDLFYEYNLGAKPFLKWVGGKRQLLTQLQEHYPSDLKQNKIKNYYEPFVGGAAVFFDVMQHYEVQNAYLYDINEDLILTYLVIQKDIEKLLDFLDVHQKKYTPLDTEKRGKYFYTQRSLFNEQKFKIDYQYFAENWAEQAARVIFLNKTCFNGLFRYNSKGFFNTPKGKYKNPKILDEDNLLKVSKLLELATIKVADFRQIKEDLQDNSFVYFDPPYRPISQTSNFTFYSKFNFRDKEQLELASLFYELDEKGHFLMLSNSDPKNTNPEDDFFETLYSNYQIDRVNAKRTINSNAKKRGEIKEIIITNY